jgi:hypothetical protein
MLLEKLSLPDEQSRNKKTGTPFEVPAVSLTWLE